MNTVTYHPFEIQDHVLIAAPIGAKVIDIVMRGDTPHAVVLQPAAKMGDMLDMKAISLRIVRPGDPIKPTEEYVGTFFSRAFFTVVR